MSETKNNVSIRDHMHEFKSEMRKGTLKTTIGTVMAVVSVKGAIIANQMGENFDKAQQAVSDKVYNVILAGLLHKDPQMTAAANQINGNIVGGQTIWDPVINGTFLAKNAMVQILSTAQQLANEHIYPRTVEEFSTNPAYQYIWSKAQGLITQYASMDNSGAIQLGAVSVIGFIGGVSLFVWTKTSHNFGKAMEALAKGKKKLDETLNH